MSGKGDEAMGGNGVEVTGKSAAIAVARKPRTTIRNIFGPNTFVCNREIRGKVLECTEQRANKD